MVGCSDGWLMIDCRPYPADVRSFILCRRARARHSVMRCMKEASLSFGASAKPDWAAPCHLVSTIYEQTPANAACKFKPLPMAGMSYRIGAWSHDKAEVVTITITPIIHAVTLQQQQCDRALRFASRVLRWRTHAFAVSGNKMCLWP
jgi:hypothetical protein